MGSKKIVVIIVIAAIVIVVAVPTIFVSGKWFTASTSQSSSSSSLSDTTSTDVSSSPAQSGTGNVATSSGTDSNATASSAASANTSTDFVVYTNTQYGFTFNLPASWEGYTIVQDQWTGNALNSSADSVSLTGPLLYIRNPNWTSQDPYQDLPIMVFTLDQWNSLQNRDFAVSAAPVGPTEYGQNSKYVFALPARWDFAFQTNYAEAEGIIASNPLHPIG